MDRARHELRVLSARAWSNLAVDVRRAKESAVSTGVALVAERPTLTLGCGALLGYLAASSWSRKENPPPNKRPRRGGLVATAGKALPGLLRLLLS